MSECDVRCTFNKANVGNAFHEKADQKNLTVMKTHMQEHEFFTRFLTTLKVICKILPVVPMASPVKQSIISTREYTVQHYNTSVDVVEAFEGMLSVGDGLNAHSFAFTCPFMSTLDIAPDMLWGPSPVVGKKLADALCEGKLYQDMYDVQRCAPQTEICIVVVNPFQLLQGCDLGCNTHNDASILSKALNKVFENVVSLCFGEMCSIVLDTSDTSACDAAFKGVYDSPESQRAYLALLLELLSSSATRGLEGNNLRYIRNMTVHIPYTSKSKGRYKHSEHIISVAFFSNSKESAVQDFFHHEITVQKRFQAPVLISDIFPTLTPFAARRESFGVKGDQTAGYPNRTIAEQPGCAVGFSVGMHIIMWVCQC